VDVEAVAHLLRTPNLVGVEHNHLLGCADAAIRATRGFDPRWVAECSLNGGFNHALNGPVGRLKLPTREGRTIVL
jgi:hypothetical protein